MKYTNNPHYHRSIFKHFLQLQIIPTIIFLLVIVGLFLYILKWGHYLINSGYVEHFDTKISSSIDYNSPEFSHTVDLPLTTTYTCHNMCSSQSNCYLTGGNCTSDVDCPGCNPTKKNGNNEK